MKGTHELTNGPIVSTLMKLTLPIMATNFISTTYGLVDMMWIGKLGSGPVAAIGTASFFINLAVALFTMISIGTGVKVAHSVGAGRAAEAKELVQSGFLMSVGLGIVYMLFIFLTKNDLIGFFELGSKEVEHMAAQFLTVSAIGTIFTFFNTLFGTVLNSMGNSGKPFRIYTVGFVVNLALRKIGLDIGIFHFAPESFRMRRQRKLPVFVDPGILFFQAKASPQNILLQVMLLHVFQ